VQGFSTAEVWKQWLAMKPGLGWVHIKDYKPVNRLINWHEVRLDGKRG